MTRPREKQAGEGPGVPEALPRALQRLEAGVGAAEIDALWVFPPLVKGRREWGLVAAGCFAEGGLRRLVTVSYHAERSGTNLAFEAALREEGLAPPDRLPRVMQGVVRRSSIDLGEPRLVEVGGRDERFAALLAEFDSSLLEPAEP
ncbi:MAG: hypothetical protein D6701_06750 [Gemmatimonadetes bacterium]|nr:MAG: hypothetical protein D6701_06750 [Gemmatimonadota bacterium]